MATVQPKNNQRVWDESDKQLLREMWGEGLPLSYIARKLGRSEKTCVNRAYQMGLPPYTEIGTFILVKHICKAIMPGTTSYRHYMLRWKAAGLPVRKMKTLNYAFWVTTLEDFWKWAKTHQDLLNFSRLEPLSLGKEPDWVAKKRKEDTNKRPPQRPWSEYETAKVERLVRTGRTDYEALAAEFGRSRQSVEKKAMRIRERNRKRRQQEKEVRGA